MHSPFDVVFTAGGITTLDVLHFSEAARLDDATVFHVRIRIGDDIPLDELVGAPATLVHGRRGEPQLRVTGIIEAATLVGNNHLTPALSEHEYELRVVSELALLGGTQTCRIFQDLPTADIVRAVLVEHGIDAGRLDFRLNDTYENRAYCVQYRESSLAFVRRLLADDGISLFVAYDDEKPETYVFTDDTTRAAAIDGEVALPWRLRTGLSTDDEAVFHVRDHRRVQSGKITLRDYDFERPKLDLEASAEATTRTDLELYDYPGGYFQPSEGKRRALVRLQEEQREARTLTLDSSCVRLAVGRHFEITESEGLDGKYLVTALRRTYARFEDGDGASGGGERYLVSVDLVPLTQQIRPPREIAPPCIVGPQTARVVAPEGSAPEEIHTDAHGRAKVAFLWDRSGISDDKASAWFRTAQLQTSGSMMLPRVGWEVIVEFLEGNPDRPLVTGRLYNGMFMPPYALPEGKARTTLRTASTPGGGGSNEIRFEDKAGAEEINVRSQKATNMTAANNKTKNVGQNDTQNVVGDATINIGANQTTKITKGYQSTIGASQTVSVGGTRKVEINAVSSWNVGGDATTTVGGAQFEMDGNPLAGLLDVAAARATEYAQARADAMIGQVEGMVQAQVAQALGPIDALVGDANRLGQAMDGARNGDLSAAAHLAAGASGLPGAADLLTAAGAPPPGAPEGGIPVPGEVASEGIASAANDLRGATRAAIASGISSARDAVGNALGVGPGQGGGESGGNVGGAGGDAGGQEESNTAKGPGHSIFDVAGTHSETSAGLRVRAALNGINTNVGADGTENVGAAYVELLLGNHVESSGTDKTETAAGLVVITKADETEECASRTTMVGGAIIQLIKGSRKVTAGAPATIIGAYHKMAAGSSVTFKAGSSELVIDGSGITIKTLLLMIGAPKIDLPGDVNDM